jgi:hypothetical protein
MIQKKNTRRTAKSSTPADALAKYKAQAAPFIRILFDDKTPGFIRDLMHEWFNTLQNETNIYPSVRRDVAEFLLPLMLQSADKAKIDYESRSSPFITQLVAGFADYCTDERNREKQQSEGKR